jgi:MinD superfamily P-loop ATPase
MKQLVVLSGKGGTGKTTVTAALAQLMRPVVLADCDVEAPNLHLLLSPQKIISFPLKVSRKARIDPGLCDLCGACADYCRYGAVTLSDTYRVDEFACEGCGVCDRVCPAGAITFHEPDGAEVYTGTTPYGPMAGAELAVGEEASGKVVTRVRMEAQLLAVDNGLSLVIVDGSPGTGCPVIASLSGADFVLVVTEPSLSGLHDLERILKVAEHFGTAAVVCINKSDIAPELAMKIRERCRDLNIEVAAEIPFSEEIVKALRQGRPPIGNLPREAEKPFEALAEALAGRLGLDTTQTSRQYGGESDKPLSLPYK